MNTAHANFQCIAFCCLGLAASCGNPNRSSDKEAPEQDSITAELSPVWKTDTSFTGSESVLYHPDKNVIYVSCGNTPDASIKDGKGFIAVLNPDGSVENPEWVTGLNAPKGMTVFNGKLYVTDIDQIKIIDMEKAEVEEVIKVEDAVFLNDMASNDTAAWFSDTRAGMIYSLEPDGTYTAAVKNAENVNGLEYRGNSLYTLEKEGLKKYDISGYQSTLIDSTVTGGDGLVILDDSTFVASRWIGEIYLIKGREATLLLDTKDEESNTADISYIPGQNLVLVPTFRKHEVAAYELTH